MWIHLRRAMAAAMCFAALACGQAAAGVDLPEVVVTESALPEEGEDKYLSPGAVTVVRAEEMAGEQRSLPELIESVPGLSVIRTRGRHGYTVASIRGSTSAQVAVYVDGVLMNLQSESAVDLSSIPTENVERIEVYRGYVPVRFGAQAMGGVINIVTKRPTAPELRASLGIGSFGRYRGGISWSDTAGSGMLFAALGYESYDGGFSYHNDGGTPYDAADDYIGRRQHNGYKDMDLMVKWQDDDWRLKASWVRNRRELALPSWDNDRPGVPNAPGADLDTDRYDFLVGRSLRSGAVDIDLEMRYTIQNKDYDSGRRGSELSPIGGSTVHTSSYDTKRFGATLSASWAAGERHFVEAMADWSDERLDVAGDSIYTYLGGISKYSTRLWSATLQDTIMLDRAGSLLLTPSLRYLADDDDSELTWQVALTYEPSPNWMIKSTYGTYARSPNLYERYGDGAFIIPASSALKWERGRQFDIGASWRSEPTRGGMSASASFGWFRRDSDDLIEFNMLTRERGQYTNVSEARVQGIELEAGLSWPKWALSLSGTWLDGENLTPDDGSVRRYGMKLPNRPDFAASVRLTRLFDWGSAFAEFQHIGENFSDTGELVRYDAQDIWNAGLKWSLSPKSELAIGVRDIFDQADDMRLAPNGSNGPVRVLWYPLEGRSYYLTLTAKF